ncbi:MAG TPA: hypothetical protein VLH60_00365, partial [Sedimentisphaerales bacterium]|nr:hypothetical protein [Sedimentisphaerales bacterium]
MIQINKVTKWLNGKKLWVVAGMACVLIIFAAAVLAGAPRSQNPQNSVPLFTVNRGPLKISISCAGSLVSRDVRILHSELEGRATIISIIADGSEVKRGDLLVELDASTLNASRVDQQISVQRADAAFIQARENLAVAENQAKADVERAELDVLFAQQDLVKYRDGEFPNRLKDADAQITMAKEELNRAQERLKWSNVLFAEEYLSATELQADELSARKAELAVELAESNKALLIDFTHKRQMAELESNVSQTAMALERTRRRSAADLVQAQTELSTRQSELEQQRTRLAKIEEQINKARIYSPIDGRAIHATSAARRGRWEEQPLAAGQTVVERQELIHMPTATSVKADVRLHESSLRKVRPGMLALVTADALPNKVFQGHVAAIAPLPDAQSMWMNPDLKVYATDIVIEGDVSQLMIGWNCRAEIIVEEYDDVLFVPVQAVTRIGGKPTVFLMDGDKMVPREVVTGLDNGAMIKIYSGISEGEQVVLTPPLDRSGTAQMRGESAGSGNGAGSRGE